MINPQAYQYSQHINQTLFFLQRPFVHGSHGTTSSLPIWSFHCSLPKTIHWPNNNKRFICIPRNVHTTTTGDTAATEATDKISVEAIIKVKVTEAGFLSSLRLDRRIDDITDLLGKSILLELVSSELDSSTGEEKETIKGYAHKAGNGEKEHKSVKYETELEVPKDVGNISAILIENEHHKEMFLETVVLQGFPQGPLKIDCASWVHSKFDNSAKRVFFTNKLFGWSLKQEGIEN